MINKPAPIGRLDYELAYCAWVLMAPTWVARYPTPQLTPWAALVLEVLRMAPAPLPDDTPGQHVRRAILRGATPEDPYPGERRGRAIAFHTRVRTITAERLAQIGTPAQVVRALGAAVELVPASRTA